MWAQKDYTKASCLSANSRQKWRYFYIALIGLYISLIMSLGYFAIILGTYIAIFMLLLYLGIFIAYQYFIGIPSNSRRIFSQQTDLHSERQVEISPEMLELIPVRGVTRMQLADFHKYKVSRDLILLYQSDAMYYIFPRRCFQSEADVQTFLSYLKAKLGLPTG